MSSGRESASVPAFAQARDLHFHQVYGLDHMSTPGPLTMVKAYSVLAGLSQPGSTPGAGRGGVHSWGVRITKGSDRNFRVENGCSGGNIHCSGKCHFRQDVSRNRGLRLRSIVLAWGLAGIQYDSIKGGVEPCTCLYLEYDLPLGL